MKAMSAYNVVAFDKTYLLRGDVGDTFAAESGKAYSTAIGKLLVAAGFTNALLSLGGGGFQLNSDVVSFPASWNAKTAPI
jgi:hypothetical protein